VLKEAKKPERALLSGNEAIARGAWEAGCRVATAYPGTPSTEILENLAGYDGVDVQWSPNEKVALEVGMGSAFCGARVLVAMKHVGLNVAADPLMTLSYTGTKGGIVIVSADDPGMHSSQNEQDNRNFARMAKIPMLEPSDSEEARRYIRLGFELSEAWDTPVLVRVTTRICHSKGVVKLEERKEPAGEFLFERDPQKWVMVPGHARTRHTVVEERLRKLREVSEAHPENRVEGSGDGPAVVTSGVAYEYVRECLPEAPVLKLGMSYPLPRKMIEEFARKHGEITVVEELDPFLEDQIRSYGIPVKERPADWLEGELTPDRVAAYFGVERASGEETGPVKVRPPVLCPGCPHRAVFVVLKKLKLVATGDIGCYTLGALPPLRNVDTCVCMGAGVCHAHGFSKVLPPEERSKVVAVIGDSTFLHSGITGLLDIVYNQGQCTILILDNGTTAMTGRQEHPGTGKTLRGDPTFQVNFEELCRSLGVRDVRVVDPLDQEETRRSIQEAVENPEPSVVICRAACNLIRGYTRTPFEIDREECTECEACLRTGCPAIQRTDEGFLIDPLLCHGCSLCQQQCRFGAIHLAGEAPGSSAGGGEKSE
jgi:indolepyruvate ferredoxin oxidoreductase alpha subunit